MGVILAMPQAQQARNCRLRKVQINQQLTTRHLSFFHWRQKSSARGLHFFLAFSVLSFISPIILSFFGRTWQNNKQRSAKLKENIHFEKKIILHSCSKPRGLVLSSWPNLAHKKKVKGERLCQHLTLCHYRVWAGDAARWKQWWTQGTVNVSS